MKNLLIVLVFNVTLCSMYSQPNLIPYRKFDKWGYCDKNKKIIITPNYDYAEPFENGFARVKLASEKFYINTKGEKVDESAVKKSNEDEEKTPLVAFEENGLYGYKDSKGNIAIKPQYQKAKDFTEGLGAIMQNNKWGYIDTKGKVVIPLKYDDAWLFDDKIAVVAKDGYRGYIDNKGNEYWENPTCNAIQTTWLKNNIKLNYEIDYLDVFTVEVKKLSNDIDYCWYKNGKKGFDVTIAAPALEKATKHFNQIYSFGNDSWLYLNDATSVFCSRQMFNEMKTNKKVTFYPYANEKTAGNPVTLEYKESKTVCVKQNNAFIGLPCLVFEAATGERLVVLDNQQYPLIVQMQLTFKIFLKSIE